MAIKGPYGFTGGMNNGTGPYSAPNDSYVDAQNVEIVEDRIVKKAGYSIWNSNDHPGGGGSIFSLHYYNTFLVSVVSNKIAYLDSTVGGNWTEITGAVTFSGSPSVWGASLSNILVLGHYGSTPIQWTGTGNCTALGGTPPYGCYCGTMVSNYLFMANNSTYPSRVFWSQVLDPNTWPAANYVDVRPEDGQPIQAIIAFGEDLLIFKKNCVARFYTNQISGSLGPMVVVNEKIGCAGLHCVDRLPDGRVVFMGYDLHVYIYDGNTFTDISNQPYPNSNIQKLLNSSQMRLTGGFETGSVCVYKGKSQVWISYPFTYTNSFGKQYNGVTLIYNYVNNIWVSTYADHFIYKMVNYISGNKEFFMVSGYQYVYREDGGEPGTAQVPISRTAFDAYVVKSIFLSPDSREFCPASVYVPIYSGSFTGSFCYGANGYGDPKSFSNLAITGAVQERKKIIPIKTNSTGWNTMQVKFIGALSNQDYTLSPFYISDDMMEQM
jgi:hypothetical protein